MAKRKHCFVVMPFALKDVDKPRYDDPNHWAEVYEGLIAPALQKAQVSYERDDKDLGARLIVESLLNKIEQADIILCDLSSHNPNVFLELGWALRADKPYVLIKDDLTDFTFDLGQQFTIEYDHRLQPIVLKSECERLTEAVVKTLNDTQRRYSVVQSMAISSEAIEAAIKGEYQTQILLDIQRRLVNVAEKTERFWTPTSQFPWSELLRRALSAMFLVREDSSLTFSSGKDFIRQMREKTASLNIVNNRDIQISIITENRIFAYHDWDDLIGRSAQYSGIDGKDIYDPVFTYPYGAMSWIDRATNMPGQYSYLPKRMNVALFSTVKNSDWRIVVETHCEIA